jgi:Polysaccharide deacetylase
MSFTTLMYHEIRESNILKPGQNSPIHVKQDYEDNLPSPLFVTLENFTTQMEYLYENNYHTLSLEEVINYYYKGTELPEKSVLITFDDCYQSIYHYAYPILKKYKFNATAFVVTGWLNSKETPFMPEKSVCLTEKDLEEMKDVFEYANHTDQFHTRTSTTLSIIMEVSDEEFLEDLKLCNESSILSVKNVFAYPFGLYCDRNVELLKNNGFSLAFTSQNGKNDKNTNPLLLKRNVIPYFMDMETFKNIIY